MTSQILTTIFYQERSTYGLYTSFRLNLYKNAKTCFWCIWSQSYLSVKEQRLVRYFEYKIINRMKIYDQFDHKF